TTACSASATSAPPTERGSTMPPCRRLRSATATASCSAAPCCASAAARLLVHPDVAGKLGDLVVGLGAAAHRVVGLQAPSVAGGGIERLLAGFAEPSVQRVHAAVDPCLEQRGQFRGQAFQAQHVA